MSQLTREFESTGETAMYRKEGADYHTLRYVNWLEAKVENLQQTNNKQSTPCSHEQRRSAIVCPICNDIDYFTD
jgi:hypothetical protein